MTNNILAQHEEVIARNQVILDKFKAENQNISHVSGRSLISGIGINDSDYTTRTTVNGEKINCEFYITWTSMILRCYSDKFQKSRPTYKGCTVCDEWHSFMTFKSWMEKQDYEGKELDKDTLVIGNKVYTPDACIFVSRQVNTLLLNSVSGIGNYPSGVTLHRRKYDAQVCIDGRQKTIGSFHTANEAEAAYVKAKTVNIIKVALEQTSAKLMKALIMHANYMRVNLECKQRMIN